MFKAHLIYSYSRSILSVMANAGETSTAKSSKTYYNRQLFPTKTRIIVVSFLQPQNIKMQIL